MSPQPPRSAVYPAGNKPPITCPKIRLPEPGGGNQGSEEVFMSRPVTHVSTAREQREGGGFLVRRPFPAAGLDHFDPLLLLDEMGPITYGPGEALGAPDHPHRGFETVTYILEGEAAHADSAGHAGTLGPGDVQWMTAGSGVVHREMPSEKMLREGGRMHGFQLWVNLPKDKKLVPPRYQEIRGSSLPRAVSSDGSAAFVVIAGRALGQEARVRTHTPILYVHASFQAGSHIEFPVESAMRAGVYVFRGALHIGEQIVQQGQFAVLGAGDSVNLRADEPAEALILGGTPLSESIAWGGPFVMNSRAEVIQAYEDYRGGRMGQIPPEIVRA